MADAPTPLEPYQHTIRESVTARGRGLHSGRKVTLTIHPGPPDSGIVLRRTDRAAAGAEILANWENVSDTRLCTVVSNSDGHRVRTVEHLMAALSVAGIDNAVIELDADEVPIMDGSALPFCALIAAAGRQQQAARRRYLEILRPFSDGSAPAATRQVAPADRFDVEVAIEVKTLGRSTWRGSPTEAVFRDELAPARSFSTLGNVWFPLILGKLHLIPYLRGVTATNALAIFGTRVINPGGLRMENEFVRHRTIDLIGDLALAGGPILGHVTSVKGNHFHNNRFLRRLFATPESWRWTTL